MSDTVVPEDERSTVGDGLRALHEGQPLLLVGDRAVLVLAAGLATERLVAWTARHSSGLLSVAMPARRFDRLHLPTIARARRGALPATYTVPVDARRGVTYGVSAHDRALTARVLADPATRPADLTHPGHMFPVRVRRGGPSARPEPAEAAVELCALAGLAPVAVTAELLDDQGRVAGPAAVAGFGRQYGLPLLSPGQVARYRSDPALRVQRLADTTLPIPHGRLRTLGYRDVLTGAEHLVLVAGTPPGRGALVRMHLECLTGDAFGSRRCDCRARLDAAIAQISAAGGVLVYQRRPREAGLLEQLAAYARIDSAPDGPAGGRREPPPQRADCRTAAAILHELGLADIRLLADDPRQVGDLRAHGVAVADVQFLLA